METPKLLAAMLYFLEMKHRFSLKSFMWGKYEIDEIEEMSTGPENFVDGI